MVDERERGELLDLLTAGAMEVVAVVENMRELAGELDELGKQARAAELRADADALQRWANRATRWRELG